jgi:hypothetical protein
LDLCLSFSTAIDLDDFIQNGNENETELTDISNLNEFDKIIENNIEFDFKNIKNDDKIDQNDYVDDNYNYNESDFGNYACTYCSKNGFNKTTLIKHIKKNHPNDPDGLILTLNYI